MRDRISGTPGGVAAAMPPLISVGGKENEDDEHEKSSIAILGSSLPRSPGHTLETQMYKMRLRGPNAHIPGTDGAAPRVSSPLAAPPGQQTQAGHNLSTPAPVIPDISKLASPAVSGNSANSSSSHTPSNYFRASLPPLAGTPKSRNDSASSSIASLAHASLKATSTSANPYSHRDASGSGEELPAQGGQNHSNNNNGSPVAAASSNPLANAVDANDKNEDVQMKDAASADADTDNAASGSVQRKPTVMRKRAKLTRTRWHFGIRSRSQPADVMAEVYRALRQLKMTWKHFNPYHLRAKYVVPSGSELAQLTGESEIKIDLQLYKLDSRDNYLVDFKAVIPQLRAGDEAGDASRPSTYRAGENTLITPLPPFIQAARRRFSAAGAMRPGMA
ncbi:Protein kinase, partial [Coemansia erecta]